MGPEIPHYFGRNMSIRTNKMAFTSSLKPILLHPIFHIMVIPTDICTCRRCKLVLEGTGILILYTKYDTDCRNCFTLQDSVHWK